MEINNFVSEITILKVKYLKTFLFNIMFLLLQNVEGMSGKIYIKNLRKFPIILYLKKRLN